MAISPSHRLQLPATPESVTLVPTLLASSICWSVFIRPLVCVAGRFGPESRRWKMPPMESYILSQCYLSQLTVKSMDECVSPLHGTGKSCLERMEGEQEI
jgi:hypothetical protein